MKKSIYNLEDTIVAIATALGQGGIGILRLSGPKAVVIADQIFISKNNKKPSTFKSFSVHYGWIKVRDEVIDEVLLTVMRTPNSYTKEDCVEISCHGGMVAVRAILNLCIELGARLAEPGEFTKRAFLNGRIDLAQAEAVLDIISAKTESFLKVSTHQLKGDLTLKLEEIRENLMNVYTELEAIMNFPEDDIDTKGLKRLADCLQVSFDAVGKLLSSSQEGRILKEGIKIVICGRPNVGKSSLLNVLLKQPRAIVSDVAGTTRDTIEESAQIGGIPFQLVDTAGILEPRDLIEEEAIKRSHLFMNSADLVMLVVDGSKGLATEDRQIIEKIKGQKVLIVVNKSDLNGNLSEKEIRQHFPKESIVNVSALRRQGIEELEKAVVQEVWHGRTENNSGVLISNLRHIQALKQAQDSIQKAQEIVSNPKSLEFVSDEIKQAVHYLDSITGRDVDVDLIDTIFSKFCIGK